ncbi:hypothetical protein CMO88_00870 [Candidatus Woesearchaeota archaeon]|nr:hypothetical protein [Candidatus Woesearchaeota archaeon]|tara:strand:- start:20759 stop:20953 length:195 start_codon:yes stop_codon:yes gene_type:complete
MKKPFFTSLAVFAVLSKTAFAYIDPGTGATIIGGIWQLLIAVFAAIVGVLLKIFWRPIKGLFRK